MTQLVLCVDRDNDLGRKTGITGPLLGVKECTDAAIALAQADPLDTDANTIFETVKTYNELKKAKKDVALAVLTGDERVGIHSDEIVASQLQTVLSKCRCNGVIFISDGADDEQLIPIIQSFSDIISVKRVIVKQAERLENMYYTVLDFMKRVMRDPELSRLILGVPGIAAVVYAFFGGAGWRLVAGVVGLYLIVKGLQLEDYIDQFIKSVRFSIQHGKPSIYVYAISLLLLGVATATGLNAMSGGPLAFLKSSDFIYLSAIIAYFLARALDSTNISMLADYVTSGLLLVILVWGFDSVLTSMFEGAGVGLLVTPIFVSMIMIVGILLIRKLIKRVMKI